MSSPADLRILQSVSTVLGADDSLQSINTHKVSNCAIVACAETDSLYILRRESAATPSGEKIVAPSAGPGRWFIFEPGVAAGSLAVGNDTSNLSVSLDGAANFHPPVGDYTEIISSGPWSLNTSTGVATWSGADNQKFLVNVSLSMYNTSTTVETSIGVSIDANTEIPFAQKLKTVSPVDTGSDALFSLSLATIVELDAGQTVQVMVAGQTTTLTITNLVFTLTPLG